MANDLIVIGGGPAGVEAALTAAPYADTVNIVSDGPIGDWSKMMSSRIWQAALEHIAVTSDSPLIQPARRLGYDDFDLSLIADHTNKAAKGWQHYAREECNKKGVTITVGQACFHSPNQLLITNDSGQQKQIAADSIIIASGSTPYFPAGFAPDADRVFSPGTIEQLKALPQSILVVGDGCIGFEFVDIFSQLGIRVCWLVLEGGPRSNFDPEVDEFLISLFEQRGVQIEAGPPIAKFERGKNIVVVKVDGTQLEAEMAFVNVGHRPNLTPLNLAAAGLQANDNGFLKTDEFGRSDISHIYVVGGAKHFGAGNVAMAQARIAALHATQQNTAPFDRESTVICFGLNPQIAQVGTLRKEDGSIQSVSVPYEATILSHINHDLNGFVRVAWDERDRVVGGLAAGSNAADSLAAIAMSIKLKASIDDLAGMQGPHPAISELPYIAARKRA